MEEKITLETVGYLVMGLMLWTTFLWGFLYITMFRKFSAVFLMFEAMATGIASQHGELAANQGTVHKSLSDQHAILVKSIKEKEELDENDYH